MAPFDVVARYLTHHNQFNLSRVKYPAFMPTTALQTSVFGIDGITAAERWGIGAEVAKTRRETLYGRGDVATNYIYEIGLSLDANNTPLRHANIIKWPEKQVEQQQLALKLAENSNLSIIPANSPHA